MFTRGYVSGYMIATQREVTGIGWNWSGIKYPKVASGLAVGWWIGHDVQLSAVVCSCVAIKKKSLHPVLAWQPNILPTAVTGNSFSYIYGRCWKWGSPKQWVHLRWLRIRWGVFAQSCFHRSSTGCCSASSCRSRRRRRWRAQECPAKVQDGELTITLFMNTNL